MSNFPPIPNSITNNNVSHTEALDNYAPFDYVKFLKITKSNGGEYSDKYYEYYISKWNYKKNEISQNTKNGIIERYREFIRDISLNYTTEEEKKFLSKIDFNDPLDLEIVIPFYTKKIYDISEYYRIKREETKFELVNKKIKGTNVGIAQRIKKNIVSLIENLENSKIDIDIDSIKNNLEVEIEELYDTHDDYYNQYPDSSVFDKTDMDYGLDIFLKSNDELISEIFSGMSEKMIELKEYSDLFDNKRELTKQNIYTSYYYISTGNTKSNFLSGKLFDVVNNSTFNFFNRNYPTHIFTEYGKVKSEMEYGFFLPYKKSAIVIDGKNLSFTVNTDKLLDNTIYYYADPNLVGDNTGVISQITDYRFLKRDYSSGTARNEPYSKEHDTKFFGYASKIEPYKIKYLEYLENSGYFRDYKYDLNGNLFGLLIYDESDSVVNPPSEIDYDVYQKLNGHLFYDNLYNEGYYFDYAVEDYTTFQTTSRSGLSGGNFGGFIPYNEDWILDFGNFTSHQFPISPDTIEYYIIDGITFKDGNGNYYQDPVSSDLSAFEISVGPFYYTNLIEGGIATGNPITRALVDNNYPNLSASFVNFGESSEIRILDGGLFSQNISFDYENGDDTSIILPSDDSSILYSEDLADVSDKTIFIRNSRNNSILPILEGMDYLNVKYDDNITRELSGGVNSFEISNDIMFIETETKLVIEKISFIDGKFINNTNTKNIFTHNTNFFDKISNRYKVDDYVFFCKTKHYTNIGTSTKFYLEIYRTDLKNNKTDKLYPTTVPTYFEIDNGSDVFIDCSKPFLTHSKRNNIFSVCIIFKNSNYYPVISMIDFYFSPDLIFTSNVNYQLSNDSITNILSDGMYTPILSSNAPIVSNNEIVI